MRTFIILLILLALKSSFAQLQGNKYFFKEVGWTLVLPAEFKLIDSADNATRNERGKKLLEEANDITADISETKTLISATKNTYNYFNSTITPFDPSKDGDYNASNKTVRDMTYKALAEKMPDAKIDSSSTEVTIDGLTFNDFRVTVTLKEKVLFNMVLISKLYKGYDFGISYLYLDEKTKGQVESIINNSRFTK